MSSPSTDISRPGSFPGESAIMITHDPSVAKDANPVMEKKKTVREALSWAIKALSDAGVPEPRVNAERLLSHALKCERHELFINSENQLKDADLQAFEGFVKRRAKREPLQYITGIEEFRGLTFKVTGATLIPRPETELLVEEAVKTASVGLPKGKERPVVVDLCTGSGCIAVTVAKEIEGSKVYATDSSKAALIVASENAQMNGVAGRITFLEGDLFEPLIGLNLYARVDMILSNPPYVAKDDMDKLLPEIKDYEPHEALFAGVDGLMFLRRIISGSVRFLTPGGYLMLEVGYGQAGSVIKLIKENGCFEAIEVRKDYSGIERIVKTRFKL